MSATHDPAESPELLAPVQTADPYDKSLTRNNTQEESESDNSSTTTDPEEQEESAMLDPSNPLLTGANDPLPPLDLDPTLPLEVQLKEAVLHVLSDRAQRGVCFGFGYLLHRLDPAVRQRLDARCDVDPEWLTATPRQFDAWLIRHASDLGLKAFVPPGGGRAEYRLLSVLPTEDELELVEVLRKHVNEKKCVSVGDFYRDVIKPSIKFRAVVNTTFGADSARFARCHPEVCSVLSNRFILNPMPPVDGGFTSMGAVDSEWVSLFLEAVRSFMRCQRHAIPVSMVSQAFSPWKVKVQAIWSSWKGMFDANPHLFKIAAPGALTGRADLYQMIEGDQRELRANFKAETAHTTYLGPNRGSGRPVPQFGSGSRGGAQTRGGRGGSNAGNQARQGRPMRSDLSSNWRTGGSKSAHTSPEGDEPMPRRHSAPSSPSDVHDSPSKFPAPSRLDGLIPTAVNLSTNSLNVLLVNNQRDCISAVSSLQQHPVVAVKVFGYTVNEICAIAITARTREMKQQPIYIFDMTKTQLMDDALAALFVHDRVLKVFYHGGRDIASVASRFGVAVSPCVDALNVHERLMSTQQISDEYKPAESPINLNFLMARYGLPQNSTSIGEDPSLWRRTGVTPQLLEFAAREIAYLLDLYTLLTQESEKVIKFTPAAKSDDGIFADLASAVASRGTGPLAYEISFIRHKPIRVKVEKTEFSPDPAYAVSDLETLIATLPDEYAEAITQQIQKQGSPLSEIVLDLGRQPRLTLANNDSVVLTSFGVVSSMQPFLTKIIAHCRGASSALTTSATDMSKLFGENNTVGLPGTLHSITALTNVAGEVVGLTFHAGLHYPCYTGLLEDVIFDLATHIGGEVNRSVGVSAKPTTEVHRASLMRDMAAAISTGDKKKRVVVIDTNNHVAGASDIPHDGIGSSRRIQVPSAHQQHGVISQCITSNRPDCIVVGEVMTQQDISSIFNAIECGIDIIAGLPTHSINAGLKSKTFGALFGTFAAKPDRAAYVPPALRGATAAGAKRLAQGAFAHLVEITSPGTATVYANVDALVEKLMKGEPAFAEERWFEDGKVFGRLSQIPRLDETALENMVGK